MFKTRFLNQTSWYYLAMVFAILVLVLAVVQVYLIIKAVMTKLPDIPAGSITPQEQTLNNALDLLESQLDNPVPNAN